MVDRGGIALSTTASRDRTVWVCPLVLAVVGLVAIYLYGGIDWVSDEYASWDLRWYTAMAEAAPALAPGIEQPFAYRLLGPFIIALLPMPTATGFQVASVVASEILLLAFYALLRRVGIRPIPAAVAAGLFALNKYLFGFTVWNFFQFSDVLALICLVCLFYAMYERKWLVFAAVLLLGSLTRETPLLMVVVAFVYLAEEGELRTHGLRLGLAVLPAAVCFVMLRVLIESGGGMGPFEAFRYFAFKLLVPRTWWELWPLPFIPLSFLPVVFAGRTRSFLAGRKHMLVLFGLVLATTLCGSNTTRLLAPAFIAFYMLIATIIQDEYSKTPWLLAATVATTTLALPHHFCARYPLETASQGLPFWGIALVLVTSLGIYRRWRGRRETLAPAQT